LDLKHIVLTGVSRGLGRALLDRFATAGHHVSGCARSSAALESLAAVHGERVTLQTVDLRSAPNVQHWANSVIDRRGPPDLLICNAAVINRNQPLWEVSDDEISEVLDINVRAVASLIRCFVPSMLSRRTGVIATLSSGWGRSTAPDVAPYCASKWAIEGMTLALASELPRGMCAVPVNPGIINTDMLQSCFGAHAESWPDPAAWAVQAAPFFLQLGPSDNGRSLTVPDF
jgi:NAD(P)-dependent dehydrogenase (short-subunit alcohol dehydrogenase family)